MSSHQQLPLCRQRAHAHRRAPSGHFAGEDPPCGTSVSTGGGLWRGGGSGGLLVLKARDAGAELLSVRFSDQLLWMSGWPVGKRQFRGRRPGGHTPGGHSGGATTEGGRLFSSLTPPQGDVFGPVCPAERPVTGLSRRHFDGRGGSTIREGPQLPPVPRGRLIGGHGSVPSPEEATVESKKDLYPRRHLRIKPQVLDEA